MGLMPLVLALSDEVEERFYATGASARRPDVVVACGDLPFDYLEHVVTTTSVPLLYVPGNHDPDVRPPRRSRRPFVAECMLPVPGAQGCVNVDGRVVEVAGMRVGGLGGSARYRGGPNQYTQREMRARALALELRCRARPPRRGRRVDVLLTHAPPRGVGDGDDAAHEGFDAFHRLIGVLRPHVLVHGHVHPYGPRPPVRRVGATDVVNAVGHRWLEVP